ncbi:MAG: transcriptional repressor NrdR [Solirubrobacterales bacterium]|nr:transcriptional repressor NrdR [Solirubrobacterales bacterium]
MHCPVCEHDTRVIESRPADDGSAVRRRRACINCGRRQTTFERFERPVPLVRKRSGDLEPFDRAKLRAALIRAAHKRPVEPAAIASIVERIELESETGESEIAAERISEAALEALGRLDAGAFLQYAGTLPDANPQIAELLSTGSVRAGRKS